MTKQTLVVSGTFTVDPVSLPLRSWLGWMGMAWDVRIAPYGQAFQQLLDASSLMGTNQSGANLLLIRMVDWCSTAGDGKSDRHLAEFLTAVDSFLLRSQIPLLVVVCESVGETGNLQSEIISLEQRLCSELSTRTGVQVIPSAELERLYPVRRKGDPVTLRVAHIPYTQEYFTAIASVACRMISSLSRPPYKVIALDCDQTLWDGVCAEDGVSGVRITAERQLLQRKVIDLRNAGMLVCLCSKNQHRDVWSVIDDHPDMVLRRQDITADRINWEPKSENLRSLARQLNLGLDSFIFVDDNPIECAEVRANCPEVLTLQLPHENLSSFLTHTWAFDLVSVSDEDRHRARRYSEEHQRQQLRQAVMTLDEFLACLELKVNFSELDTVDVDRVAQLTQRTNQMNFTTIRRDSHELKRICRDDSQHCIVVRVADKFGDYGLVGTIIYRREVKRLLVDTFLLSCRALGRRVEKQMLQYLGHLARVSHCSSLVIQFQKTDKNQPAGVLVQSLCNICNVPFADSVTLELPLDQLELALTQAPEYSAAEKVDTSSALQSLPQVSSGRAQATLGSSTVSDRMTRIATELTCVEHIHQRIATQAICRPEIGEVYVPAQTTLQKRVAEICCRVMNIDRIGINDSLKSLGLSSLHVVQILGTLHSELQVEVSITELFTLPTIRDICQRIDVQGSAGLQDAAQVSQDPAGHPKQAWLKPGTDNPIAVIGLAGRFPGAENVTELWQNLVEGRCSIVDIPEDQLNLPAESPLRRNPNLVRRAASITKPDYFDAKFFGIFPKEAQVMDPQHRILLECCWHALEDAGYQPDGQTVPIGLFAGCYMDTYILASLASNPKLLESLANSFHGGDLQTELGNDKDYLATRISYLLNLRGPAITVQTACSTSLVAMAQACQSLVLRQCDMALAGGVTLKLPQDRGYLYAEGGMVSPDGVCRTFDARARGTVFGEGAGVVVLKRLDDALADGDDIYAVIKGWGLNNDGRAKLGYTAPSTDGQFEVISMAHRMAEVSAETISYMEAHGTGTALGDPIEVDALTRAFRQTTNEKQFCAIGSLKTNIGHLDVAAGVSGMIKVCLAMKNQAIPASLNFESPNHNIDFENSPFFVNTQLRPWRRSSKVRRAGLSSFGVGGTNAHMVIEESPEVGILPASRPYLVFPLSARSPDALQVMGNQLVDFLDRTPNASLSDVAYTLQTGRKKFNYSRLLIASRPEELQSQLRECKADTTSFRHQVRRDVACVWMFPGQGAQFINMGKELYETEPVFAEAMDECFEFLQPMLEFDLRERLFVQPELLENPKCMDVLRNTQFAQPAIFCVAYSYAQWLLACGVRPQLMIGHSVGEFIAACLGGVFSLSDALRIVVLRAKLMQQLPEGNMLAVRTSEDTVRRMIQQNDLGSQLSIAAVNSPSLCVVSGPANQVSSIQIQLEDQDIAFTPLHTSHAFHSCMMDPAIEPFANALSNLKLAPTKIPIISTVTGQPLTEQQACDPQYWARHLRETVRFSDAVGQALKIPRCVLVEVGPGQTLSTLARQHSELSEGHVVTAVSPHAKQNTSPSKQLWSTLGTLWQEGVSVDFSGAYRLEQRQRLHLPGYPFERQRYWFDQLSVEDSSTNIVETLEGSCQTEETEVPYTPGDSQIFVTDHQFANDPLPDLVGSMDSEARPISGYDGSPELNDDVAFQTIIEQQLAIMQQQLEFWNNS